jgi:hypothetical protein
VYINLSYQQYNANQIEMAQSSSPTAVRPEPPMAWAPIIKNWSEAMLSRHAMAHSNIDAAAVRQNTDTKYVHYLLATCSSDPVMLIPRKLSWYGLP